ncbi:MAG: O-antigen ligase family protein, partial [Myxococcales bacterium]|nr:O-antigen ligase family protein [Myxococcales bacterium]
GLLGIATSFGLLPLGSIMLHYGRLEGFFKDENVFGAWCVPICVYAIARLVALRGGRRWWWLATLVIGALVVLLTYSRGAWINLALSAAVFYILRLVSVGSPRSKIITIAALPLAITALGVALFEVLSMDAVQDMLETRLKMQSYDTHRFATQEEAVRAALEHPLGIGPGQSELVFERAAHSTYVRSLVENGFLGFLSLVAFMALSGARAAWYAVDALDDEQQLLFAVVAGAMAGLLVESLVIDSIHWRHFFVVLALAWLPCRGGALRRRRGATR